MEILTPTKEYKTNNTSVYSCQYHIIFCTKYRRKVLTEPIQIQLKQIILDKQSEYGYLVIEQETIEDHVHLLLDINPFKYGVGGVVSRIKGYTAHTLREQFPELKKKLPTLWTRSKFVSSVGAISLDVVKKYIAEQKSV